MAVLRAVPASLTISPGNATKTSFCSPLPRRRPAEIRGRIRDGQAPALLLKSCSGSVLGIAVMRGSALPAESGRVLCGGEWWRRVVARHVIILTKVFIPGGSHALLARKCCVQSMPIGKDSDAGTRRLEPRL